MKWQDGSLECYIIWIHGVLNIAMRQKESSHGSIFSYLMVEKLVYFLNKVKSIKSNTSLTIYSLYEGKQSMLSLLWIYNIYKEYAIRFEEDDVSS